MLKPGNFTCFEITRFSVSGDQNTDATCPDQHSQDGVDTTGAAATRIFELWREKNGISLAATIKCCVLCSQLLTEGSHNGETYLDKCMYFLDCS